MTREEVKTSVFQVVARTFGVPIDDLREDTTADDVDGWDSLAHATLLIRLEKTFNADIGAAGNDAQDLGALVDLVCQRTGV
jgi:acyl carrier protein